MLWLPALGGGLACTLLAPSDEELRGALLDGGGAGGALAAGGAGTDVVAPGGTGGSAGARGPSETVGEYPIAPPGGSTGTTPDPGAPPVPPPDAGPLDPPEPCIDCETVRFTGALRTVELGTPGGELYMDVCPRDQVAIGMDYRYTFGMPADFGYITSVSLVCGDLAPNRQAGSLDVVVGEPLPPRGQGAGVSGSGGRCPPGQVVTGFEGARNFAGGISELREVTLHCAPIALGADGSLAKGPALPTQPMSAEFASSTVQPYEVLALQSCPEGQVARGAAIHAGNWVDGVSFICSTPVLALPDGQACELALDCQSGRCDGTCQPRPCAAPEGCACELHEDTQYAFCEVAQPQPAALAACAASGMHLANALDPIAHGWLRNSAGREGIQAAFWLGADDLVSEDDWQWAAGAGPVDLNSELWDGNEQRGGTAENCLAMTRNGQWDDVDCTRALPFACEAPAP